MAVPATLKWWPDPTLLARLEAEAEANLWAAAVGAPLPYPPSPDAPVIYAEPIQRERRAT